MSSEDEERFQLSNKCWIADKLFDVGGDKVRDNYHVMKVLHIGVIMLSLNWQKVPVIFHNLRGYETLSVL